MSLDEAVAETMHLVPHSYASRHCAGNRAAGALRQIQFFIHRGLMRIDDGLLQPRKLRVNATEVVINELITTGKCDCSKMWASNTAKQARRVLKRLGWISEDSDGCAWVFIGPSDATVSQFAKERLKERKK